MSNILVLRTVYALNSNTGQFISSGQVLITDGLGGTQWADLISSVSMEGLRSTLSTLSSLTFQNTSYFTGLSSLSSDMYYSISTLSIGISLTAGTISQVQLVSTVGGLGSYYTSTATMVKYTTSTLTSTNDALGNVYFSSLDSFGQTYLSSPQLVSTVYGLATANYVSSTQLVSTTISLSNQINYAASNPITVSTVSGLGSYYVSTASLVSTTTSLVNMKNGIRFDTTNTVITVDSINSFSNVNTLIYISTFFTSSLFYSGINEPFNAKITNSVHLTFSTLSIDFSPFSSFMNSNSRLTLELYPTIAFSKLATGATNVAMLPISSFLQVDNCNLTSTTVGSHLFVGNTRTQLENGSYVDSSNIWNTPIKMSIPPGQVYNTTSKFSLVHYMPSSMNSGPFQNALHSNTISPFFASTCVFLSIQNLP